MERNIDELGLTPRLKIVRKTRSRLLCAGCFAA
jgi:hypothetical protein